MKPIDIFLIIIIISVVALVVYFGFIKNKGDLCRSCPYSGKKNCHCKTKEFSEKSNNQKTTNIENVEINENNDNINDINQNNKSETGE